MSPEARTRVVSSFAIAVSVAAAGGAGVLLVVGHRLPGAGGKFVGLTHITVVSALLSALIVGVVHPLRRPELADWELKASPKPGYLSWRAFVLLMAVSLVAGVGLVAMSLGGVVASATPLDRAACFDLASSLAILAMTCEGLGWTLEQKLRWESAAAAGAAVA